MKDRNLKSVGNTQKSWIFVVTIICSLLLFAYAAYNNSSFTKIMSVATFLTWHNLFEPFSILAAFSIFIVTYYTYEESGSLRMIILGCSFLAMASLDVFHTLSFKGMPDFLIPNISSNRATTFWILSRVIGSAGIFISVLIPLQTKSKIKKWVFVIPTCGFVLWLFYLVTYYPGLFPAMFIEGHGLTLEKIMLEYLVALLMGLTLLKVASVYRRTNYRQEFLFMLGILLCIFSEMAFISYANVYDAYNYLGHIYKFIAYFILFNAIYTDNVRMPYREMKKARNELKGYSENLNNQVKQRTIELENMNEILMMDLECAKDIQLSLLPSKMPEDAAVSFEAGYFPAEHLSGDFYNVIKLNESNIAIYIGDVAGHGVSAAMVTVFAYQNIKPFKDTEDSIEIFSPGMTLQNLYRSFNKTNFKDETYIVMLYGIYNTQSRCFTYASAGLNVPPMIIKHTGEIVEIDARGFAICKLEDIITPFYQDITVQLEPRDKILFYTDGLVEAENPNGNKYNRDRLNNIIKSNGILNDKGLADAISKDISMYIGDEGRLKDDVTFLVMDVG